MATDKNFVVKNGLTVGTSEVITSAGNLTNVGTITSSGSLVLGSDDVAVNNDANITIREGNAFAGIDLKSLRTSGNISGIRSYNSSNALIHNLLFEVGGRANLNNSGGIALNNTTFIDASRNLTNIGTISSGAITSTGAITSADFFKATGGNLKFSAGGNHIFNVDLNGKIYPQTHNAVDLGFSSSLAFRNLYLSGTISSGAITSSGNVVLDAAGHNYIELHSATANTRKWRFYNGQSWNPDALLIYDQDADSTALTIETNKLGISRGANSLSHTLDVGGNVAISGTEIITSARNLTNIGTISSGAISANSGATNVVATFTSTDATAAIALTDNTGTVELSATGTTFGIQPNGGAAVLTVNSSGNLTTAGTISSGAITTNNSVLISYSGNDGAGRDAGLKIQNDGNDWGAYIRKASAAQYGLRIDSAGDVALAIYGSEGGSDLNFSVNGSNGAITTSGNITLAEYLYHGGDTGTNVQFTTGKAVINAVHTAVTAGATANQKFEIGASSSTTPVGFLFETINKNETATSDKSLRMFMSETGYNTSNTNYPYSYGLSLVYEGSGVAPLDFDSGFSSTLGNGQWGMYGHENSVDGVLIVHSDRAGTFYNIKITGVNALAINSSRNATFAGTINSGAITSSGALTTSTGVIMNSGGDKYWIRWSSGSTTGLYYQQTGGEELQYLYGGSKAFGVTASGNATFSGTISSGAITSSGNLHAGDGTDINMDASANGQLEVDGNGYQGAIALNGSAMHIYHNSSSRDLILGTNETARLTIGGTGTFDFNSNNLQSIASITATGLDLNGNADISGSLNMSGGHIYMNNFNIYDINTLTFSDPGPNEGIAWTGGNTKIYESPDDLTTNTAGNLQFVYGSTRRLTVNSTGIDVNNTITTTYVDAETLKANDSGTTPGSCKLHVGSLLSAGSSAVAQLGGFVRMSDQLIIHSGTSADTVFIKYSGGNIDLTEGEVGGANPATIVNDLRSTARGSGWEDQLNLISSDGTNKWNVLVDNGSGDILRFGYNSTKRVDISTGGNVDTTGFFEADQGFRQAIPGNDGLRVYGENANQPLIRVSANAIGNNSADYGFTLAYRGDRSGNENSLAIYSDNQEGTQVEAINIKQDGTTHFGADVYLNSKKMFFNSTSYGVGAGGHNFNSVYVDTLESGLTTDALELCYYSGRGVNIGQTVALKNLGCGGIKIGGADNTIESGYMLHLASTGDAAILLEADTDNVTETDNPKIRFRQDGGAVEAQIMLTANNDFLIDQIYSANNILFGFNSVTKGTMTNSGDLTMTGNVTAYSDERLKTNIETLDPKKTLQMRGVSFEKEGVQGSGVIAQELEKVAPELVLTNDDEMGTKSVAYGNLVGYLIETIKEQQKDIDKLKEQVSSLTPKN
jgi:hypothetical protein